MAKLTQTGFSPKKRIMKFVRTGDRLISAKRWSGGLINWLLRPTENETVRAFCALLQFSVVETVLNHNITVILIVIIL